MSRARFLTAAAAAGVAGTTGGLLLTGNGPGSAEATEATGTGTRSGTGTGTADKAAAEAEGNAAARTAAKRRGGLTYRGVCYEVIGGETPHTGWSAARMRADLRAIDKDLHASSVSVFGDGVERLRDTANEAAERGLHVWLQPRLSDRPQREILDHLAETGRQAERLRRQGAAVHLSVGCEFLLFVPGIVPGDNVLERIENLSKGNYDPERMMRRLNEFIAKAARTGRSVFHGKLTYGAAEEDPVDWRLFDLVSVNYYSSFPRRADHVRRLRTYRRWGKPVVVSEFGTCTYRGAPEQGGMGWDVVDYEKVPQQIKGNLVRSERTQARHLAGLLDVFESMDLYAALVYNFVSPDAPHWPEPRYDLDLASYALVKPRWRELTEPGRDWHWEPKQAFGAVARHYARARP
ncbi:abortive phage infection protein [Streptomyces sp. NA04227]|nr:abortive phage infection protein [Streptomyces sp. NA04227]